MPILVTVRLWSFSGRFLGKRMQTLKVMQNRISRILKLIKQRKATIALRNWFLNAQQLSKRFLR